MKEGYSLVTLNNIKENAVLFSIMIMVILLCCNSQAQADQWEAPYMYTVTGGEAKIDRYFTEDMGVDRDVVIPDTIGGFPVTSTRDQCFYMMRGCVTSISFPDNVNKIGSLTSSYALQKIKIPNNLTNINDNTFTNCSRLSNINIPKRVTSIGEEAFSGCTSLSYVLGGEGVTSIGDGAFYGCTSLAFFEIPKGVTCIGDKTFFGCSSMSNITIPEGITSIGKDAFIYSGLNSIKFESSETEIYDSKDTIPEGTKIIGYSSSSAKEYAKKYNRTFENINAADTANTTNTKIIAILVLVCFLLSVLLWRSKHTTINKQDEDIEKSGPIIS